MKKYYKLRLYNWIKYTGTKLTKDDLSYIKVIKKYDSTVIIGTKDYINRLYDLTAKFVKWYD